MTRRPESYRTTFYRNALDFLRALAPFPTPRSRTRTTSTPPPPPPAPSANHTYYRNSLFRALADTPMLSDDAALQTLHEFVHYGLTGITEPELRMGVRLDISESFDGERRRVETVFRWLAVQ